MRFLLDANLPYSSLAVFKDLGLDAQHVSDLGLKAADDERIMAHAAKTRQIVVTRDLDFGTLAVHLNAPTEGVVILRLPFSFTAREISAALKAFLSAVDTRRLKNSIAIVEVGRYRIRKLRAV